MQEFIQLINDNRQGKPKGIYAVCSAHPLVLEAAFEQALADQTPILIEATANQVNQFGGYTDMTPVTFFEFVHAIAKKLNFPSEKIYLGGDHLGPVCWQNEPADNAMAKAKVLISQYVAAGFKKIHLDCSMPCLDDILPLTDDIIAERAAILCQIAEQTAIDTWGYSDLVYVIGTEVPPPGGADEEITTIEVTEVSHVTNTLALHFSAFEKHQLTNVWPRVIGLVVQPGVEFDHTAIIDYCAEKTTALKQFIQTIPHLAYEAHSTDYQTAQAYKLLIQNHFAILKVGPQLTFALREALFALSFIEEELLPPAQCSNLRALCEQEMLQKPSYWQRFYQHAEEQQTLYRRFSYSDRIRYYWPNKIIQQAINKLFNNLEQHKMPLPLISQFLPEQYHAIRNGDLSNSPKALVKAKIKQVTHLYSLACWKQGSNAQGSQH